MMIRFCVASASGQPVTRLGLLGSIEAVRMQDRANASEYGLAAGVFTSNLNLATTLSRGLRAGTVWVSCMPAFVQYVELHG